MKTDLYTKIVLTVIAICLCLIVVKEVPYVSTAFAQNRTDPVPVNIVQIGGKNFGPYQISSYSVALPVKVE
jgi:hypothetical protein